MIRILVVAVSLAAIPTVASARTNSPQRVVVQTRDLDLTTDRGATELEARVAKAAWQVCDEADAFDMLPRNAIGQCASRVARVPNTLAKAMVLAARKGNGETPVLAMSRDIEIALR